MSADDVVTAGLRGLELGEVAVAPGVEDACLLAAVSAADLAAFNGQSPAPASRYRSGEAARARTTGGPRLPAAVRPMHVDVTAKSGR